MYLGIAKCPDRAHPKCQTWTSLTLDIEGNNVLRLCLGVFFNSFIYKNNVFRYGKQLSYV